jgi:hypothetical protein
MDGAALAVSVIALVVAGYSIRFAHQERARQARKERAQKRAKKRRERRLF